MSFQDLDVWTHGTCPYEHFNIYIYIYVYVCFVVCLKQIHLDFEEHVFRTFGKYTFWAPAPAAPKRYVFEDLSKDMCLEVQK